MSEITKPVLGGMFDSTEVIETASGLLSGNKSVDSSFFAKMISCFYRDGIFGKDSFTVTPSGGIGITVSSGIAWCRGRMAWLKESTDFTLQSGADYTVLLRLDTSSGEFTLAVKDGISSARTETESVKELIFANIGIPADSSAVTEEMITDRRGERLLCGYVTSTVDALEAVEEAQNSAMLASRPASDYLLRSGGVMEGVLKAKPEDGGSAVVRNIGYGTQLPDSLGDGEMFILLSE